MIQRLHAILAEIAARRQRQRFNLGLSIVWWFGFAAMLLLWRSGVPGHLVAAGSAVLLLAGPPLVHLWSRRGLRDPRSIAKSIEKDHPELQTALLAALDQSPDPQSGSLSYLQNRVILESLVSAHRDRWVDRIPRPRLTVLRGLNLLGLLFFLAGSCFLLVPPRATTPPLANAAGKKEILEISVDPGDVEIERGTSLTIQARFGENPPSEAMLETTDESGSVASFAMNRPFTEPVYQAKLENIAGPLTYRVVLPDGAGESWRITVFDRPSLRESEVVLNFPEHLGKPPETIKNPRAIRAEEQTRMDLTIVANIPGLAATLVAKDREPLKLEPETGDGARFHLSMPVTENIRYQIVLTDSAGRTNTRKEILDIKVIANKAPVVKVVIPRKGEKVTPIQEVGLEAGIVDDSPILASGMRYTLDGENWVEIEGLTAGETKSPRLFHRIDLEAAGAKPNDVIMWNAWAEDTGPDGRKRRVNGDVHLVQVRSFDEEFYQQSGGAASPGADLIKIQTQILNSSWNLRRDHVEISNTSPTAKDLATIHRSQEIAIETASGLEAEETDPSVRRILTDARLAMEDALAQLEILKGSFSSGPLDLAINHEQAALRSLYQLKGSKTMISQGEGESSSAGEETPKEDLDLKPMDSPYQTEKRAKPEAAGEAGEAMAILKRLDELAKRQRDLNEEMQALQMALNQAESAAEKAEIERQLKQLRDQQRDLLADVDELRQKTADPEQKATEPEQNKALDDVREKARQANEELGKSQLGEALAAGRRAQESLEELHDEFRESSAARLAEDLRELRRDARALEEKQQQLAESNAAPEPESESPKAPGLRDDSGSRPEAAKQREDLQKLLDGMRETAETAERAEPLVAQDLAEALRQADQNGISRSLEAMEKSPGNASGEKAAEGISNLTRQIEGAAERILGDEEQALRFARDELKRLAEQAAGAEGKPGESGSNESPGGTPGKSGAAPGQTAGSPGENGEPGQPGEGAGEAPAPGGEGRGDGQEQASSPGGRGSSGGSNGGRRSVGSSISGEEYKEWSDRLYDLEAILEDPEAQSAVARARKASRDLRKEFNRHAKDPDQETLEKEILRPLVEAAAKLDARLHELNRENPLAPVGRDPVPERYSEIVRRYFEELGK